VDKVIEFCRLACDLIRLMYKKKNFLKTFNLAPLIELLQKIDLSDSLMFFTVYFLRPIKRKVPA